MRAKIHKVFHRCKTHKLLIIIIIIICVLECYSATQKGLWIDEFFSWGIAKRPLHELAYQKVFDRWYVNSFPPFYEIIVHLFLKCIIVENDLTLRLPTILFFILAIVLLYIFTLKLSKNKKAAIIAALLTATSPGYFHYGSMLRSYLFMVVFVILSFFCMYAFIESHHKKRFLVLLSAIHCCMMYTFYPLMIIIGIEMLALRIYIYKKKQNNILPFFIICFAFPFIAFIPWYSNFAFDCFVEFVKGKGSLTFLENTGSFFSRLLWQYNRTFIVHGMMFPISLFFLYKKWKRENASISITSSIVLACVLLYVFIFIVVMMKSYYFKTVDGFLYIRYFLPVFFIIIIYNSITIAQYKNKILLATFIVGMIFLNVYDGIRWHINMPEMKQAASYVKKFVSDDNQTLIFIEDAMFIPGFLYYFAGRDYAYMATQRYWGDRKTVNETLKERNIKLIGNRIHRGLYVAYEMLEAGCDIFIVIDSAFFDSPTEFGFLGEDNFINSTEYYMEQESLIYQLLGKKHFNAYTVAVYKNLSQ
ncbi:MAG: glycosyltransferase family 39 protein [Candidatus Omnitrophica bacterium]|nr:glycosyltransferase family 39 protein [Candidatus Omnitrophota bacterium]